MGAVALAMNRHLAIVPAHNELGAIATTIAEIRAAAPDFDVLVIDDGSTDETAAAAARAGGRVVSLPFNLGVGAAVQCGYIYARAHGYEVAVQVDGDGQHDPRDIPRLLDVLDGDPQAHLVTGSAFSSAARAPLDRVAASGSRSSRGSCRRSPRNRSPTPPRAFG